MSQSPQERNGDFLLEVRAEEIPARMLPPAVKRLGTRVFEELMGRGLAPRSIDSAYTPRRLVLVLTGLPAGEPDREERVVGPPARIAYDADGQPTKALEGFARKLGLEPSALERIETDKGEYVSAVQKVEGQSTAAVLAEMLPRLLAEIPWPKTMRWGHDEGPWIRPVHGVVALLDGEVVPFELFGVAAGRRTVGHPILSPAPFEVSGPEDYREALAERGLVADPARRREVLLASLAAESEAAGGRLVEDPDLLARLVAVCEIPGVMAGSFDERYLELPREVLVTALKDHQSAFTVEDPDGRLLARFLTVMDRADDPAGRVRAGNEWVVAARLADARFFFDEDRKRPLAERAGDLEHLTFHVRLGSYAAKAERLAALARHLAEELGLDEATTAHAEAAARLLKVDLTTEMVKEFTSLQGVVGGIYARLDGQPEPVAEAIYDQYLPASTDDPRPRGTVARVAALADRLDTLVGIFGLGLVPSGSRDPFGLRRAAQGVVRIAREGALPVDLAAAARRAVALYDDLLERDADAIVGDLVPFFADRIRHLFGLAGYAYDEIEAALAADDPERGELADLPDLEARTAALHEVRDEAAFLSVVLAAKRIANITTKVEPAGDPVSDPDPALFAEDAERDLDAAHRELAAEIDAAAAAGDYHRALGGIGGVAPVLDRFFDQVLVMDEDPAVRANRLALLAGIGRTLGRVAALTEVVVDREEHRRRHQEQQHQQSADTGE